MKQTRALDAGARTGMDQAVLSDLSVGVVFAGRYRVERRIAAGGMGAVYEVVHIETNRRRALKVMHSHYVQSDELRTRFRQEARVAAEIESEHIVDVFDAGIDEATGMPFLVMELLRGEELGKRIKRLGALPTCDVVRYLYETSLALDKTHGARIVHRDLKPDNLFLCERERGPARVKVLDFGIAKIVSDASTQANATRSLGTPLYMAPEQFLMKSAVSAATDIFALGMIAFTLLVGKPYWYQESRMTSEVLAFALHVAQGPQESAVVRAREQFGVELPLAFDAWFCRVTARDPGARFATASEAIIALAEALGVPSPEEDDAPPKRDDAVIVPKVIAMEVEPPTILLSPANKSAKTEPMLTAPTQMGMTSAPQKEDASEPIARPSPRRSFFLMGITAMLVVGLGGWLVVKSFGQKHQSPDLEPPEVGATGASQSAQPTPSAPVIASAEIAPPVVQSAAATTPEPGGAARRRRRCQRKRSLLRVQKHADLKNHCLREKFVRVQKRKNRQMPNRIGERTLDVVMRRIPFVCIGLALATPLLIVSLVHGQTVETPEKQCQLGKAAMKKGDLSTGCPLLQESYDRGPNDLCLAALARCRDLEEKGAAALELYRKYLRAVEKMPDADRVTHAEREQFARNRVLELEAVVPTLKLVWRGDVPKDAQVKVDGRDALGRLNTEWPLDPGEHRIEVVRVGVAENPRVVTLKGGEPVVDVDLTPAPVVVPNLAPKPPLVIEPRRSTKQAIATIPVTPKPMTPQRKWGFIAIGVGSAALVAGGILGGLALVERKTVDDHCTSTGCDVTGWNAYNRMRVFGNVATVPLFLGVGLVGAGCGLVFRGTKTTANIQTNISINRGAVVSVGGEF